MKVAAAGFAFLALSVAACGGDEEEPPAAVAGITCSNKMLTVTPRVKAEPNGSVHVEANVSDERGVSLTINGQRVDGGVVMQLSPGDHRVKCSHGESGSMESSFEVVQAEEDSGY